MKCKEKELEHRCDNEAIWEKFCIRHYEINLRREWKKKLLKKSGN